MQTRNHRPPHRQKIVIQIQTRTRTRVTATQIVIPTKNQTQIITRTKKDDAKEETKSEPQETPKSVVDYEDSDDEPPIESSSKAI